MSQPSQEDILPPFDPTAYITIQGDQLLQFLAGATPFTDKGMVVMTTDVAGHGQPPNAIATVKWQNYIWLRVSATSASLYLWNTNAAPYVDPNTGDSFQQWYPVATASIPAGGILGYMIANLTITDANIANLNWSKIVGAPTWVLVGGAAGGDLSGTYPNPAVALAAITGAKIANNTIYHLNLLTQTGDDTQAVVPNANTTNAPVNVGNNLTVPTGASTNDLLVVNATTKGFTTQTGTTLWPILSIGAIGAANTIPQINAGATAWQMSTPAAIVAAGQSAAANSFTYVGALVSTLVNGSLVNTAHGLAATPSIVRWVLRCTTDDTAQSGYAFNDEIDISSFFIGGEGSGNPAFSVGANTADVFLTLNTDPTGVYVNKKGSNAGGVTITDTKWTVVCYAKL